MKFSLNVSGKSALLLGCAMCAWTDQTVCRNYIMKANVFQKWLSQEMRFENVDVVIRQVHAIVLLQTAGS